MPAGEVALDARDSERSRRLAVDGGESALNDLEVLLQKKRRQRSGKSGIAESQKLDSPEP